MDATSGEATVTPPASGGPWDQYRLRVCEAARPLVCLAGVPLCPAAAATCAIPGCQPFTNYTVTALALKPDPNNVGQMIESSVSSPAGFRTRIP